MFIVAGIKMPGRKSNDKGRKPSPKKSPSTKSPKRKGPLDLFFKRSEKPTKNNDKVVQQNEANEKGDEKTKPGVRLQGLSKVLKRKKDGALLELLPKDEQVLHEAFDEVQCLSEVNVAFVYVKLGWPINLNEVLISNLL